MSDKKERRQNRLSFRICSLLLTLCMIIGMTNGVVFAADEHSTNQLHNGSFEDDQTFTGAYSQPNQSEVPWWNTTAFQGKIELFRDNPSTYVKNDAGEWVRLTPTAGDYAAELNADEESTLYQVVSTTPSSVYEWGIDHGARNGKDIVALVIGPNQDVKPSKPSKDGRDHFMQMIDWLNSDMNPEIKSEISNIESGEDPKQYTVYSKKFAANGAFLDNAGHNAFSLTPSTIYTEEWHIWIMASRRATTETVNPWYSYGANAEEELSTSSRIDTSKYYFYTVPSGQSKTLFGFVSVGYENPAASGDKAKTYGNFLDNINFQLYHPLSSSSSTHGSAVISISDGSDSGSGSSDGYEITVGNDLVTYIKDGDTLKIQAVVKADDAISGCEFVGLYYTKIDTHGNPVTNYLPLAENEADESAPDEDKVGKWVRSVDEDENIVYTYYMNNLTSPADFHFIFIKNPTITYDSNGGKPYVLDREYNTAEAPDVYSFKPSTQPDIEAGTPETFIPPYVSKAAEGQNDGWKFMGWLLTGDKIDDVPSEIQINADELGSLILPAEHTVACDYVIGGAMNQLGVQYFKIYDGTVSLTKNITYTENGEVSGVIWTDSGETKSYANNHKGLTMVAQWRWRQAFIPQFSQNGGAYADSDFGGSVEIDSVTDSSDTNYNADYNGDGGKSYFAETDETVTATATANPGYAFEGWYDASGNLLTTNTTYSYTETKRSVNTFYARFSDTVTQTYIRQVKNGDIWVDTTDDAVGTLGRYSYTDAVGMPISSTVTESYGYRFEGWYDSSGNRVPDNMLTNGGTTISYITSDNATYYARFTEKEVRPNVVSADSYDELYDGRPHGITVREADLPNDEIYYKTSGTDWSLTPPTRTNVQNAETVYVKVVSPTYKTVETSATIKINKRSVTLTSKSDEKEYDGIPLTNSEITVGGDGWANGEGATYTVTGIQTRAGSSSNYFEYTLTEGTKAQNYDISTSYGTLTVTNRNAKYEITVTASGGEFLYDGTPKTVEGFTNESLTYDFEVEVGDTHQTASYTVSGLTARAAETNAGIYPVEILGTPVVLDSDGNDVTEQFIVNTVNGQLKINKRSVTLTSKTDEREYNGTPLTNSEITVGGDGWADGEGATYTVTGSRLIPGSSLNEFTYTLNAGTDAANYIIDKSEGTLTVLDRSAKYEITVVGNSDNFTYTGTEHSVSGIVTDTFVEEGRTYRVIGATASGKGTDAGEYRVVVDLTNAKVFDDHNNDVTSQFTVKAHDGKLTVDRRSVTLTSKSDIKQYDGIPLTNSEITVGGIGWAIGEGATFDVTGSRLIPGSSENTFTYTLNSNTKPENYTISEAYGTLTVTNRDTAYEINVKANSVAKTYDGIETTVEGFETLTFTVNGQSYTVSGLTAGVTKKDAGTYPVNVTGTPVVWDAGGHDVTAQFTVTNTPGLLTINKRSVTLTSKSDVKQYDEIPLTNSEIIVGGDGWADGEGAIYTVTGIQTQEGSSSNYFEYTLTEGTRAENYDIFTSYGILTVTSAEGITVTKTPVQVLVATGDTITWTVTVSNTGDTEIQGLTLTDNMEGAVITAPNIDPENFSAPAEGEIVFTVSLRNAQNGTYINHVEVTQPDDDGSNRTLAQADSEAVTVRSPVQPDIIQVTPGNPVLNTEQHIAYIIGYEDGTVHPNSDITRAEVSTIFFRLLTDEIRAAFWSQSNDYSDVPESYWCNNAISTLSNARIITGYSDGTFRPDAPITRAEFAAIAARFSDVIYNGTSSFADVSSDHWASDYISLAEHQGWVKGYADGTFKPNKNISRAEAMTLINRILKRAVKEANMLPEMASWKDCPPDAWYYEAVQEATNSHEYISSFEPVSNQDFYYEYWQRITKSPDWNALEATWSEANSNDNDVS